MRIQKASLKNIVIERIKNYISENNLKPNDKFLTEKMLTEQLKVSRTVVREALISLQAVGILMIKPGGGIYIADTKLGSIHTILKHHYETYGVKIRELVEIRKILELGALRLIIEKQVPLDIDQLKEINESYHQTIKNNEDTKKFDRLFHQSLIKATDNATFFNFSEIIHEYFSLVKIDLIENQEALIRSYEQHNEIVDAIRDNDLVHAQKTMTDHFEPIFTFIKQMEEES
ncbi:GntR family transcriptional regulator [Virgibacillus profundi]|uniref:GntR family transcriptional regulator n=1 Tax=Virgibacillus profundi TaxID=2024555 RepID=A0A2A2IHU9_9BACI|nr:FCD domain-containing protein [Virgibacillus profundi]PAV30824.1 GntR family transcriptional regulator [Virgibacillus profundi]PXY55007.1 FadR family transcriptional regulator [Virgibacillus profundi]